jgi:hypothetical protein
VSQAFEVERGEGYAVIVVVVSKRRARNLRSIVVGVEVDMIYILEKMNEEVMLRLRFGRKCKMIEAGQDYTTSSQALAGKSIRMREFTTGYETRLGCL